MSKKHKSKKQNQPVRNATAPLPKQEQSTRGMEKRLKPIFAVELFLGVVLIVSWVVLLLLRACPWDFFLLVIWAVVIIAAAIWIFVAERKLARARHAKGAGRRA